MNDLFMTVTVSLRITSSAITADEIALLMGLTPSRHWNVGEARTTPKGQVLEGVWETSYATFRLVDKQRSTLSQVLSTCERQLVDRAEVLEQIRKAGGTSELFVGWFLERDGGDTLPSELLRGLANLGLDLSLDVYAAGTSPLTLSSTVPSHRQDDIGNGG